MGRIPNKRCGPLQCADAKQDANAVAVAVADEDVAAVDVVEEPDRGVVVVDQVVGGVVGGVEAEAGTEVEVILPKLRTPRWFRVGTAVCRMTNVITLVTIKLSEKSGRNQTKTEGNK